MRIACYALFAFIAGWQCAEAQEMRNLSILTGSKGGTYYRFGEDIAGVIKRECSAELRVKESNGSLANLQRLRREEAAQLAIVQQDTLEYLKEAAPEDAKLQDIIQKTRYVFPLYAEEVHLVTTAGSGITDITHLKGKRVAVGDLESGTYLTATFILLLSQVAVTPVEIGEIAALDRLLLPDSAPNKIDAMFFVTGKPVALLTQPGKDTGRLALVNIRTPAVLQKYEATRITSSDYRWLTQSVDTVKVLSVLMSFDFRYENCLNIGMIANRLRVNLEELQEKTGHPKWRQVDLNATLPGWERYDCVSKYLDAQVVAGRSNSCTFQGGPKPPERPETTASSKCDGRNLDNPIVRSLCRNLQKLQQ